MGKFDLDFKKFKHIKSDEKTTTLQHPQGHMITLAHKALSKDMQAQLEALAQASKEEPKKMAEGGGVRRWDGYQAPPEANPGASVDKTVTHARSPQDQEANEKKVRADSDAQTTEHRKRNPTPANHEDEGYKSYAEGGPVFDYKPEALRSENPNFQPQFDQVDAQAQKQIEAAPNPYAEMYNNIYAQDMKLNPGQPDKFARDHAMNMVESQKNADQSNTKIAVEDAQAGQNQVIEENQRRQSIGLEPLPIPSIPQLPGANQAVQMPQSAQTLAPMQQAKEGVDAAKGIAQDSGMQGLSDTEGMMQSGFQNQMAGINAQAKAQGALGEQQSAVLNKNIQDQNIAKQSYLDTYQGLEQERQHHMQDIKDGYIDPNQYWNNHSKIASGIGMILAGFNPTNSPNAAVNFLKFQMEQNLDAQKQNLGAKQNMLSANLRQFGNLRDAMDMTRLMQNDIMTHELQSAAAKSQTPMAKAAAMQAAGQLQMQSAPLFQNFAMRRAMMNLSSNGNANPNAVEHMIGYMRVVNPEMAKEMQTRYVPNVGLASVSVPDTVRKEMIAKQSFEAALRDLQQWTAKNSGSISPTAIIEGRTKAANVQNLYRDAINGGVYKEGEQKFLSSIVDSEPTKFFNNIRVMPKLNEVIRENQVSLNTLKKGYGLPTQQDAPQQQIKIVNGVKYMRGPNGQAIKVK